MTRPLPFLLGLLAVPLSAQEAPAPTPAAPGDLARIVAEYTPAAAQASDDVGYAVAVIGDLDDNGFQDYALGASGNVTASAELSGSAGAVHILLMGAGNTVLSSVEIDDDDLDNTLTRQVGAEGTTSVLKFSTQFGDSIVGIGDLDGDGVPDLAVGAPGDNTADNNDDGVADGADDMSGFPPGPGPDGIATSAGVGSVYILFLNSDGSLKGYDRIDDTDPILDLDQRLTTTTPNTGFGGAGFGRGLAVLGDLDGSGGSDLTLAVGAPGYQEVRSESFGGFYTLALSYDGAGGVSVDGVRQFTQTALTAAGAAQDSPDGFGVSLSTIDLDGIGLPELVIGAEFDDDGGFNTGAVWIAFLGNSGGAVRIDAFDKLSAATVPALAAALQPSDRLGTAVTSMVDIDQNGVPDLVVGAARDDGDDGASDGDPDDDDTLSDLGAVYVLLLDYDAGAPTSVSVLGVEKIGADAGLESVLEDGDLFGESLAFLSDVDGQPGLLVGLPGQDVGGASGIGSVLLVTLEDPTSPPVEVVCNRSYLLETQAAVDAFICTTVTSGLVLRGDAITNTDGLTGLTSVGATLSVEFSGVSDLDGLADLTSVGGSLVIRDNPALANVDSLANLTSVGQLLIVDDNDLLTDVDGLAALDSVGGSLGIIENDLLTDVDGLSGLASVGQSLVLSGNAGLTNVDGLAALASIGAGPGNADLDVFDNPALIRCAVGLGPILAADQADDSVIQAGIDIQRNSPVGDCNSVASILEAFAPPPPVVTLPLADIRVTVPGGGPLVLPAGRAQVRVRASATFTGETGQRFTVFLRLDGPDGYSRIAKRGEIKPRVGQTVSQSIKFTTLASDPAGDYTLTLLAAAGSVPMSAAGEAEVLATLPGVKGGGLNLRADEPLSVFPNPTAGQATLRFALPEQAEATLVIYDALGREVARLVDAEVEGLVTEPVDASRLAPGLYVARLVAGDRVETVRLSVVR